MTIRVAVVLWCLGFGSIASAKQVDVLLISVESAHIPGQRPDGRPWDPDPKQTRNPLPAIGALLNLPMQVVGNIVTVLDALGAPQQPQSDPTAPDPYVEVDLGTDRQPIRSGTATNTFAPRWRFAFYAAPTDIPTAGFTIQIADDDGPGSGESIDNVVIARDRVIDAASSDGRLSVTGPSGASVNLVVKTVQGEFSELTRQFTLRVDAKLEGVPLGQFVPIGSQLRVVATGQVNLSAPGTHPPVDANGSSDISSRTYNLTAFPNDNFGILAMVLGKVPDHRQQLAVGTCKIFVATEAGDPVFVINDKSRWNNQGSLDLSVEIAPPLTTTANSLRKAPRDCSHETSQAIVRSSLPRVRITSVAVRAPQRKPSGLAWDEGVATAPPEIYVVVRQGTAELTRTRHVQDSFQAIFPMSLEIDPQRGPIVVHVIDKDFMADDPIGAATFDLRAPRQIARLGDDGSVQITATSY